MSSLEQILKRKAARHYHKYEGFVRRVRDILAYQQSPFDTHAGEKHVRGVMQNLDRLLPNEIKEALFPDELYLLLIATWLHDVGKIREFDKSKSYEAQIDYHATKGFDYIMKNYRLFNLDEKEALIVAYIVKSHGLFDLSKLPERKALGAGVVIEIRRLGAVLCLADELDIEYGRVPEIVKEISGIEGLPNGILGVV